MKPASLLSAILILSILGVVLSLYSLLHNQGFVSGSFCSINDVVDCDVVNKGPYSQLFGIPIAFLGVIGYGFLALGALLKMRKPEDRSLTWFLLAACAGGFLFSLYLTSLEAFVLMTWCLLCLTSQIFILVLTCLVSRLFYLERVKTQKHRDL